MPLNSYLMIEGSHFAKSNMYASWVRIGFVSTLPTKREKLVPHKAFINAQIEK